MTLPLPEGARWCAICCEFTVRVADNYCCEICWDDGYVPTKRQMTIPLTRTPLTAVERLYRGLP